MHNFCYKIYIYIYLCANLHLRCRITFYTHPASKPTSKPTILRTRSDHLRGPSGPRSTPAQPRYPDPAAPNHHPSPVVPLQSTVHPTNYQDLPAAATARSQGPAVLPHAHPLLHPRAATVGSAGTLPAAGSASTPAARAWLDRLGWVLPKGVSAATGRKRARAPQAGGSTATSSSGSTGDPWAWRRRRRAAWRGGGSWSAEPAVAASSRCRSH